MTRQANTEFDNNLRGVLFKNDRKETESQPSYKGQCEIDGVGFWISAWVKESPQKGKYMSLSFQLKEEQATPPKRSAPNSRQDDPEDLPF